MNDSQLKIWATGAVKRKPTEYEYMGLSYEQASRRAQAICAAAAETGQTINASAHLNQATQLMQLLRRQP